MGLAKTRFLHFSLEKFGKKWFYYYLCSRFWNQEQGAKNKDLITLAMIK